jgi:transposase
MYIAKVPNRNSRPAYLLRESFREGGKVKNRTLANLSSLPDEQIEAISRVLKGEKVVPAAEAFTIERSTPHGHVAAVLGMAKKLEVERLLAGRACPERTTTLAMIVARILHPKSKLATARSMNRETKSSSLGELLGLDDLTEDDLYEAMDWLVKRQPTIEKKLAKRHLQEGSLVLYDLSSSYYTGRCCPLAAYGHNRDGKKKFPQIVYGLLCSKDGCPVAIEVFEGNTADPKTLSSQIDKLRRRFKLARVVIVGDRGVLTEARIREELAGEEGLDWVTALRAPAIRQLKEAGAIDRSLFDETDLVEIRSPDYPGERLIVCRNPLLADERARKREELLARTEQELAKIAEATRRERRPLRGKDKIGLRVGKVINRWKVGKHFIYDITDDGFTYRRDQAKIDAESALDGLYIIRTSVAKEEMSASDTVGIYKSLASVERAFRSLKTVDLHIRPIHHRKAERVRAHVFLCMLAYYVEWHLRRDWRPLLFDDADPAAAQAKRESIVAPAKRSDSALKKDATKQTDDGLPAHSFRTLLDDLATLTRNRVRAGSDTPAFTMLTTPTPLQAKAFSLLDIHP